MAPDVLLVDDNPFYLRTLAHFLGREEGDVRVVGTVVGGRDAVLQAEQLRPDVVVVDLRMPERSGFQVLRELRARSPRPLLIAMSLMNPLECRDEALAAGADAFVSKVTLDADLIPTIRRLTARQPGFGEG